MKLSELLKVLEENTEIDVRPMPLSYPHYWLYNVTYDDLLPYLEREILKIWVDCEVDYDDDHFPCLIIELVESDNND